MICPLLRPALLLVAAIAYRTSSSRLRLLSGDSLRSSQPPSSAGEHHHPSVSAEQHRAQANAYVAQARLELSTTREARSLVSRWAAVSRALATCVQAGRSVGSASQAIGHRLDDLADHVDEYQINSFVSGDITIRDLRELPHGGAAEIFLTELVMALREYDVLLESTGPIIALFGEVDAVAAEEPEHVGALRGLNLFLWSSGGGSLLNESQTVKSAFAEEHDLVVSVHNRLEPFLRNWENLTRTERRRRASRGPGRTWRSVKDLGLAYSRVDGLRDQMEHFASDLESAFATWSSVASSFTSPKGSLEVVDASLCSERSSRTFAASREVDEGTMNCDEGVVAQDCQCARPERDCYISHSSGNRPEPSNVKRCFRRG